METISAIRHRLKKGAYDRLNRLKSETEAPYGTRLFQYDAGGNLTQETDRDGKVIQYVYDPVGRVVEERWMNGAAVVHTIHTWYDNVGQVRAVTESDTQDAAAGTNYEYLYDEAGNLVEAVSAPGDVAQTNPASNLGNLGDDNDFISDWDGDGVEEHYDGWSISLAQNQTALVRLTSSAFDPVLWVNRPSDPNHSWKLDDDSLDGRNSYLIFTASETGTWIFYVGCRDDITTPSAYNLEILTNTNWEVFVNLNQQSDFTYAYDAAGQLKRTTDLHNTITERDYDVLGRVTQIRQSGGGAAQKRADYGYRDDGSLETVMRYNTITGDPPPPANLVATSTYEYDDMGRLTDLTHTRGAMTINDYTWSFDAADRITASTAYPYQRTAENSIFDYDTRDQITTATHDYQLDETYTYDDNGNRITANGSTYGTGAQNRLLSDGTYNYTYDSEGHRLTKTLGTNGATTRYLWDSRGRLVKVTEHVTASPTAPATQAIRYYYDSADRLVRRTVDNENNGVLDEVAKYVFDGSNVALQYGTTATPTHRYLWDAALDQLLADETIGGELGWALPDHQGSIRDLVDSSGTILHHVQYDSFGETDDVIGCLFGYTGQYRDPLTELQLHGARWYDPAVGRFISEDPSGLTPDSNPYRYCENSPMIKVDPTGLYSWAGSMGRTTSNPPSPPLNAFAANDYRGLAAARHSSDPTPVAEESSWVMPWDSRASWNIFDTARLWGSGGKAAAVRADQFAGQVNTVAWTGKWVDPDTTSGVGVAKDFGIETGRSFNDGRAWDSVQGCMVEMADQGADLGMAFGNTGRRAAISIGGALQGKTTVYYGDDWERSGRLSDYVGPLYGHQENYSDGQVVGHYTVRAQAIAAAAWEGAAFLTALPSMLSSAYAAGSSFFASASVSGGTIALAPSAVGGMLTGGISSAGVVGAVGGLAKAGAFDPLSNWLFAKAPSVPSGPGSYNNTHQSGKTYSGKGGEERMNKSARRIAKEHGDPVVDQEHTPAADTKQSFIDEQNRIEANGGPGGNTYNKINSPGKKLRDGT